MDWAWIKVFEMSQGMNQVIILPTRDETLYLNRRLIARGLASPRWFDRAASVAEKMMDGKTIKLKTLEHAITGVRERTFSRKGASGALIHLQGGQVVGMLFGGSDVSNLTFMTEIGDLFGDMKDTGASDI
ncbi:hypothetical protein BO71DRAFT_433618 [Aspergillus ellipticus CBS 707.79]|uniref:Uncharacterized protein n=1 Tax=Aspergillus ellipticus CBS 707.79 TaxID=1448320 RepID=A0A319CZQ7_9EURO|nr:hypothetical protein BO71DRAFT_433618 [Aspergillus ellipticus CBS 707.79]